MHDASLSLLRNRGAASYQSMVILVLITVGTHFRTPDGLSVFRLLRITGSGPPPCHSERYGPPDIFESKSPLFRGYRNSSGRVFISSCWRRWVRRVRYLHGMVGVSWCTILHGFHCPRDALYGTADCSRWSSWRAMVIR